MPNASTFSSVRFCLYFFGQYSFTRFFGKKRCLHQPKLVIELIIEDTHWLYKKERKKNNEWSILDQGLHLQIVFSHPESPKSIHQSIEQKQPGKNQCQWILSDWFIGPEAGWWIFLFLADATFFNINIEFGKQKQTHHLDPNEQNRILAIENRKNLKSVEQNSQNSLRRMELIFFENCSCFWFDDFSMLNA